MNILRSVAETTRSLGKGVKKTAGKAVAAGTITLGGLTIGGISADVAATGAAVAGITAAGITTPGCEPQRCDVVARGDGEALYDAEKVYDLCRENNNQLISCFIIPNNPTQAPWAWDTFCGDPDYSSTVNKTFHGGLEAGPYDKPAPYHIEVDEDGATRLCVGNGGAYLEGCETEPNL